MTGLGMDAERLNKFDLNYNTSSRVVCDDGVELYCERYGNAAGPQVTIVNNFFIISPLWRNFTKEIARRKAILAYDLRNQGASSPVSGELKFERLVDDLKSVLDANNIEQTYLLGTSTSSLICRDFTLKYPERVKGLIMVGPLFCPYGSRRRRYLTRSWLQALETGGAQGLFNLIYPLVYSDRTIETGGSATYLTLRERFLALNSFEQLNLFLQASLTTEDSPEKLSRIGVPTLLLAGDGDFLMSASSLEAAAKLLPKGQARIIPFAGHVPYFEATPIFEQWVEQFIDSVEGVR
jgi:pimeloyl-ACP methyl ester carboxylesterase